MAEDAKPAGQDKGQGAPAKADAKPEAAPKRPAPADEKVKRRVNFWVVVVALGLIGAVAAGVFFTLRFIESERARDLQDWQIRLGIVADSRAAAVNEWVEGNFDTLRELAQNTSLQLYMTELAMAEGDVAEVTDAAAQASYLRNLLVATAERAGFKPPVAEAEVAANVERAGVAGIGLVAKDGTPIVSSPGMPPVTGRVRLAVEEAMKGEPAFIDVYKGASNLPTVGFVLPVFGIQDDGTAGIGAVVGLRVLDQGLFKRLAQPGETEQTAETYLARRMDGTVEYLSPLADGTAPLERSLAADTPDLAAAFAIEKPGGFRVARNYAGDEVLVTSRRIGAAPWVLVRSVSTKEALSETETRLHTILVVFVLIIVGVTVAIVAVWRHGSSLRAARAAEQHRIAAERFENILKFTRTVTDSQPTHIVCLTPKGEITFANRPFAEHYGIPITDIRFKPLSAVVGPAQAKVFEEINKRVIETPGAKESHLHSFEEDGGETRVVTTDHVHIPADATHPPAALMVIHDITDLSRERERAQAIMRRLTDTLVSVVDRRDPYSANHSTRVAEVGRAIAIEMDLDDQAVRTVDIAGSLMNLGKIFVPPDILTKTGNLTESERRLIARTHLTSAELLEPVPFDGPVTDTIRQMGESWDGSGPLKMKGEAILQTARILAVANAFVGMVSPRAWREAMTFEKVAGFLMQDCGTRYDRKPVTALVNFLENRGGIELWAHFREKPLAAETGARPTVFQAADRTPDEPPPEPEFPPEAARPAQESPLGHIRSRLSKMAVGAQPVAGTKSARHEDS